MEIPPACVEFFVVLPQNEKSMKNFIHHLEIKNFKSIKHLKTDCKRVNVFIGEPNVGKSNILEALGLLGVGYSTNSNKILGEFIRYEKISNLFYDDDLLQVVEVITDQVKASLSYEANSLDVAKLIIGETGWVAQMQDMEHPNLIYEHLSQIRPANGKVTFGPYFNAINPNGQAYRNTLDLLSTCLSPIRKYEFKSLPFIGNKFPYYLIPPNGSNLFSIVNQNKSLRTEIGELLAEYGFRFVADQSESRFDIEKLTEGYYVNKYPYSSIADTFQRLIFYFAAIDSNKDAVLILEEPEVHSFPPYTKDLADRIVASTENQFFITTHSPYILQNLIEELDDNELNIFITYFENYETKIKCLSGEDLSRVADFNIDLFWNLRQFISK